MAYPLKVKVTLIIEVLPGDQITPEAAVSELAREGEFIVVGTGNVQVTETDVRNVELV